MAKKATSRPLRIATWNINSVRLRLANVARFVAEYRPDVLCLQETKASDDVFPDAALAEMGFAHRAFKGDKGYNGVAILSKVPFSEKRTEKFGGKDHARHLTVTLEGGVELHDFYVPAGGDVPDPKANEKFAHKLKFVADMTAWCKKRRDPSARRILVGDLNIAPLEHDVWSHKQLIKVVSHTPVEVAALDGLKTTGDWVDSARKFTPETEKLYSWWSYRSPDWSKADKGRRLDHVWLSPALADGLKAVETPRAPRGWAVASDHVPVIATIAL
jgi:exodeoxyribonuclease-3